MTTTTFPSGNTYTDANPAAEAAAKAAAEARITADPTIDDKPAAWPTLTGITTVADGVVVEVPAA